MTESLQERMARFANMNGNSKPPEKPKREFKPKIDTPSTPSGRGALMRMLDDIDVKQIGRVR